MRQILVLGASMLLCAAHARAASVLLISVDGLRPDYVTRADRQSLQIPVLRQFLKEGAYAQGVTGVTPTVTYPSHTTLISGVTPSRHGIYNNTPFDPQDKNRDGWYWYAADIEVPTLFDAVRTAGRVTASVEWPVTVGAAGITYNIPEYRRAQTADDQKLLAVLARPDGYLRELEMKLGPYAFSDAGSVSEDQLRVRFANQMLEDKKPVLMAIHLLALDHECHSHGAFSPEANAALEALDTMIGKLRATALRNDPDAVVAIVSDHGIADIKHDLNWRIPFIAAGLLQPGEKSAWKISMWSEAGASAAVMLRDPADQSIRAKVRAVLETLRSDSSNGIASILEGDVIKALGAWPMADFVLALKPGYVLGDATTGPLITPSTYAGGTHGYLPTEPDMYSSFLVSGNGVAKGRNLGKVSMLRIAPTLAKLLNVQLPDATEPPLPVFSSDQKP